MGLPGGAVGCWEEGEETNISLVTLSLCYRHKIVLEGQYFPHWKGKVLWLRGLQQHAPCHTHGAKLSF